jgi:hypothetical protein
VLEVPRPGDLGTFFIESTGSGEHFANRCQVLDNLVASRGLLLPGALTLDPQTVQIYRELSVATPVRTSSGLQPQDSDGHIGSLAGGRPADVPITRGMARAGGLSPVER